MNTTTQYLPLSEIQASHLSDDEIRVQIQCRESLLKNLIGGLYPAVVLSEIDRLYEMVYDPQLRLL